MKIPKFKTIEEERAFWDKHSIVDYLSELEETKEIVCQLRIKSEPFLLNLRIKSEHLKKL